MFSRIKRAVIEANLHRLFELSIFVKGVNGVLETVGGLFLLVISRSRLEHILFSFTHYELAEDPNDALTNYIMGIPSHASIKLFGALYLLIHGIVNLILVTSLARNKLWAFPVAITVLSLFLLLQVGRLGHTFSWEILMVSVFDTAMIALIAHEYGHKRAKALALPLTELP